jgi:glycerophosphoryl diester phosphodiesterase
MAGDYHPAGVALQIPETYGPHRLVTPETIRAAHAAGLEMHVWTVNEEADIRRLLAMGVDGVMSDWPAPLLAAFR